MRFIIVDIINQHVISDQTESILIILKKGMFHNLQGCLNLVLGHSTKIIQFRQFIAILSISITFLFERDQLDYIFKKSKFLLVSGSMQQAEVIFGPRFNDLFSDPVSYVINN